VWISGHLNLEAATLRCPLSLDSCYFDVDKRAAIDYATASSVTLARCHLAGLSAKGLFVKSLDLKQSGARRSGRASVLSQATDTASPGMTAAVILAGQQPTPLFGTPQVFLQLNSPYTVANLEPTPRVDVKCRDPSWRKGIPVRRV
jgi:hypothetical protein